MTPEQEQEYRAEAERLRQLPVEDQRAIVELHRSVANDKEVSAANRKEAGDRAEALEKLLRLRPRQKRTI